jgi:hypothetical protein
LNDKVIPFPGNFEQSVGEAEWKALQAEFYLDCYLAARGRPASDPQDLQDWLLEARIPAEMDSAFFRGWLVRRLSEDRKQ